MDRSFQLGSWYRVAAPATSSSSSDVAQSRNSDARSLPNTLRRFASPVVFEFTSACHTVSCAAPAPWWSAAQRRKLHVAPRVESESSSAYGELLDGAARNSESRP